MSKTCRITGGGAEMKYLKKPIIIEAELYQEGMEDKFVVHFSGNMFDYHKDFKTLTEAEEFISDNMGYPMLDIEDKDHGIIYEQPLAYIGKSFVRLGDYVVTDGDKRYPRRREQFLAEYDLIDNLQQYENPLARMQPCWKYVRINDISDQLKHLLSECDEVDNAITLESKALEWWDILQGALTGMYIFQVKYGVNLTEVVQLGIEKNTNRVGGSYYA